ncbi:MAG: transposase [Deltaproteobacteria bacterium]|nr:transposase [Deltaproteobacteria bacterium]
MTRLGATFAGGSIGLTPAGSTDSYKRPDRLVQDRSLLIRKNILILDNASWHRGDEISWGNFEPVFLPAYSPDLNPIERLWLVMKSEWLSDFFAKSKDQLIDRICLALNWVVNRKDQNQKTYAIKTKL